MHYIFDFRGKRGGPFNKPKQAGASILKDTSRKRSDDETTNPTSSSSKNVDSTNDKSTDSTFKPEDTSSVCSSEKDVEKSSPTNDESVELSLANPQEESGYDSDQTLSQNSSAKDSDTNSYDDSPTSSPKNVNKMIQAEETIVSKPPPVKVVVGQITSHSHKKSIQSEEVIVKKSAAKSVFESIKPQKDKKEQNVKKTETLFGPSDILKPKVEESIKPVDVVVESSVKANSDKISANLPDDELIKTIEKKLDENYQQKPVNHSTDKLVKSVDDKPVSADGGKPINSISEKPVNSISDKPINSVAVCSVSEKPVNHIVEKPVTPIVEGKPKIATKPVLQLGQKSVTTALNLRAVLQNGLNLKTTFKLRPMLSLSR